MKKIIIISFSFMLFFLLSEIALAKWEKTKNLYRGTISNFAVIDSHIITYGTEGTDGIHFSSDYGETWDPDTSTGTYTGEALEFFVANKYLFKLNSYKVPGEDAVVYRIYVSTDYGKTWRDSYHFVNFYGGSPQKIVLALKDTVLYAAVDDALIRSYNYGDTWNKIDQSPSTVSVTATRNGLYIIGYDGVMFSSDDAISWTRNQFLSSNAIIRIYEFGSYQYAISNQNTLYISTDSGKNWEKSTHVFSAIGINSISNLDTILFITTVSDGIYKSTDNGLSWLQVNLDKDNSISLSKDNFFVNYYGGLYSTIDKGNNFNLIFQGYEQAYTHKVISTGNILYTLTNCGVYLSSDFGSSWKDRNKGLNTSMNNQVLTGIASDSILYIGLSNGGGVWYSSNFGLNWKQLSSVSMHVTSLFVKDSCIYAGLWMSGIMLSTDNGMTWTFKRHGANSGNVYSILIKNNKILLGSTGEECGIYLSEDNGVNYQKTLSLTRDDFILNLIQMGDRIFACSNKSGIYTSSDDGKSWERRNLGMNGYHINSLISRENYLFVATNSGVYYSNDSAMYWVQMNEDLGAYPTSIAIAGKYLFVTCGRRNFYRSLLSDYGLSDIPEQINKENVLISPNPATDFIEITCRGEVTSPLQSDVRIYDIYGQIVSTSVCSAATSASGGHRIDVSNFARGMYFVRIGGRVEKFVKL